MHLNPTSTTSKRHNIGTTCATLLILLVVSAGALAQSDSFLGIVTFPLWESGAPGALGKAPEDVPTITMFRPHAGTGNGTSVIVAPGGAYLGLAANLEGRQVADWFTSRGVTAFVLRYRLGRNYQYPVPLTDARRAIRLVRSRAKEFGIASDRIGMMGFSAGGHLAAMASTMFEDGQQGSSDPVERVSSRPDFQILGYPWANAMKADEKGVAPYCAVMNANAEKCKQFAEYSPDLHVSAQTPPAFIYHTTDDELVPVDASVTLYRALHTANVPVEMHIFGKGKHGSGLGLGDAQLDLWPTLLEAWLRARGLLTPDPAVVAEFEKQRALPGPRKPNAPFSVDLAIGELLSNPAAKAIVTKHLGEEFIKGLPPPVLQQSVRQLAHFIPDQLNPAKLQAIEAELAKIPVPPNR